MASRDQIALWIDSLSLGNQSGEFVSLASIDPQLGDAYESLPHLPSVRASALPVTAYTAGDTKDPGFQRMETPVLAQAPSRVSRRYAPLRREEFSGLRSPDPAFPDLEIDSGHFAYPMSLSRPTTLMELFQEKETADPSARSPVFDDDLVPIDPVAAMLARQMGLAVHDWEFQPLRTQYAPQEEFEDLEATGVPLTVTLETADAASLSSMPDLRVSTPLALKSVATEVLAQPWASDANDPDPSAPAAVRKSDSGNQVTLNTSASQAPNINLITNPDLPDMTAELELRSSWGEDSWNRERPLERPPLKTESSWGGEVTQSAGAEVLREALQQSQQQLSQLEAGRRESERIAVARAEKRIRDRLRSELPPPPPEEVAPRPRDSQVSMNPISEPLRPQAVPDPKEAPVTVRELQVVQEQQAIYGSALRHQIVSELRNETEAKIEHAQKEAEVTGHNRLRAALRKIINS